MSVPRSSALNRSPIELRSEVQVTEFVRVLRSSFPSIMVKCDDGYNYVINQPDAAHTEANIAVAELGTRLAVAIGLPISYHAKVIVDASFALKEQRRAQQSSLSPALRQPGSYYGSRLAGDASGPGWAIPHLSRSRSSSVINRQDFVGMRLLQLCCCCRHGQRAMFVRAEVERTIRAIFVDSSRLLENLSSPESALHLKSTPETNFSLYSDLFTEQTIINWIACIEQQVPAVLEAALLQLASNSPAFQGVARMRDGFFARTALLRKTPLLP